MDKLGMMIAAILSAISTLLPLGYGAIRWQYLDIPVKLIVIYCLASVVADSVGIPMAMSGHTNALVTSLFSLSQLVILGMYFAALLSSRSARSLVLTGLLAIFLFLTLYGFVLHEAWDYVAALHLLGFSSLTLVALSIHYFYVTLSQLRFERIEMNPYFWITSGIFLHLTSCVTLTLLTDMISSKTFVTLWIYFKNIMQILMNLLFVVGIFLASKQGIPHGRA